MSASWHFRRITRGEPVIEPTQEQFFNQDAISESPVRAIVREGIQNALDAQASPQTPVHVHIALMRGDMACRPGKVARIFMPGMRKHIDAEGNGLQKDDLPEDGKFCDYLVFEDFGTTGLTGDVRQYVVRRNKGEDNNFFNFFRAVGATDKRGNKLGKWGIGKHTFWGASRVNTVFGFTVRQGAQPELALMGKTILKSHAIDGGVDADYQGGYYGLPESDSDMVLPLTGDDYEGIALFRDAFKLRRADEPGLSLVVPWIRTDIAGIKRKEFVSGVVADYFYPILAGQLTVNLTVGGREDKLDAGNIEEHATDPGIRRLVQLAKWMKSIPDGERQKIEPKTPEKPDWLPEMFQPEALEKLSASYRNGNQIALRVMVEVSPKKGDSVPSYFDIALVRTDDESSDGHPCFIRGGIIIPRIRSRARVKNITALVAAEDAALADFLGSGENPSHTEWQRDLLKKNYRHFAKLLDFVCDSVHHIVQILTQADEKRDREILADIFPMPKGGKEHPPPPPPPLPPPKPQACIIGKIEGGFLVTSNPKRVCAPGSRLTVCFAYNSRLSNPLGKYKMDDFQPDGLHREESGLENVVFAGNEIKAKTAGGDFRLRLTGFDKNRDIYIKATVAETQQEAS